MNMQAFTSKLHTHAFPLAADVRSVLVLWGVFNDEHV